MPKKSRLTTLTLGVAPGGLCVTVVAWPAAADEKPPTSSRWHHQHTVGVSRARKRSEYAALARCGNGA